MPRQAKPAGGTAGGNGAGVKESAPKYTPTLDNRMMRAALKYADFGYRVLPLKPKSKDPFGKLVPNGVHDATRDPDIIRRWWSQYPDANIGLTENDVAILDVDPRGGGDETLARLIEQHGPLPDTPQVITGRGDGGNHLYFRSQELFGNPNLGPGLQIKGKGHGYVVAPPSIHPDTGKPYVWEVSAHVADVPLADMPDWMEELATRQDENEHDRSPGWFAEWMQTPIPEGGRRGPGGIPRAIGYLGGHGHSIEETIAMLKLWDVWNAGQIGVPPLGETEIRKHVESMFRNYGYTPHEEPVRFNRNGDVSTPVIPELMVRSLATVETRPIDWQWERWLARRKLHVLGGVEGDGKSTVTTAIAAEYSKGGRWPDGTQAPIGKVLFLAAEDGIEDILKPRLELHGADLDNIMFVEAVKEPSGAEQMFSLARHLPLLEDAALAYDIGLIIIDPLSSFMPSSNRNDEGEVRDLLTPLSRFAENAEAAILGVMHLNRPNGTHRRASQRLLGSTAFGAVARMVWIVAPTSDDPNETRRVLAVGKTNLAMKPKPLEWSVSGDNQPVVWHGESDLNVNELLSGGGKESRSISPEREAVLHYILNAGCDLKTSDIAKALDKSPATISDHVSALENAGLILRVAFGTYAAPKVDPPTKTPESTESTESYTQHSELSEVSDIRSGGTGTESSVSTPNDNPADTVQALYDSGFFDDMEPIEIDGGIANPLTYAKQAITDARQPGAVGRAGQARCQKLLDAIEITGAGVTE